MVQLPLPRFAGAAVAALAVGVLVAGGWNLTKPDPDQRNVANAGSQADDPVIGQPGGEAPDGETSDDEGSGDDGADGDKAKDPAPTLTPLPQPTKPYPTPKMPSAPGKDAPELDRIEYKLQTVAWTAAGKVFDDTEVDCDVTEDDLADTGDQNFDCNVSFAGVTTTFDIDAKVTTTNVVWEWQAEKLPVTEEKALHEVRRWGFRPAKTTCDLEGVEPVEVDAKDGVTCWVTTSDNQQIVYNGQLVDDGSLNFNRVSEPS